VDNFHDKFCGNTDTLINRHNKERIALFEIRQRFKRLVSRIGYLKGTAENVFEKQRKKDVRKLRKKKFNDKIRIYMEETN